MMDPLARRAVALVRRRYGIPAGVEGVGRWTPQLDALASKIYRRLRSGEGLPDHWR